jgi:hypothetical protein
MVHVLLAVRRSLQIVMFLKKVALQHVVPKIFQTSVVKVAAGTTVVYLREPARLLILVAMVLLLRKTLFAIEMWIKISKIHAKEYGTLVTPMKRTKITKAPSEVVQKTQPTAEN